MDSKFTGLTFKEIGEAMRPENLRGEAFHLSREERDHIAGHALDSISYEGSTLTEATRTGEVEAEVASSAARKIAALSNLLSDIGWEREASGPMRPELGQYWPLGELFPVAQLRPWLEEWQRQDDEALTQAEEVLQALDADRDAVEKAQLRLGIADAQTKLGTGAILLARIEKWMASHEN